MFKNHPSPISQPVFEVYVSNLAGGQSKQLVSLRPDKSQPGLYEGFYTPKLAGRYLLEANENDKRISSTTEFQVSDVRQELLDTGMRPENLQRIAELTGGAKLGIRELDKLTGLINGDPINITLRSERPLWDNALVVILLITLLGGEWILRRKHDLP